ncbi:hypothetical protein M2271_007301 [Streptomyces sp. LBL]|uniref:hypothetical protein n=1 Tax=Streptomyces sp. LBL TaxID=2940562 RepID=UPI0024741F03|nr:hypothetical protein [Streptomyces sp. LBL]MDH6629465.1 hypothetical protein [Streptomyces sp. LBL]
MSIRAIATSAATLGLVLAGSVVVASPASAYTKTCTVDQSAYSICFDGDGDKFIVDDLRADGERAVVKWYAYDGSGREGECADANGSNNGPVVCDYDFKEGTNNYVSFMGFTRDGNTGPKHNASWAYTGYISPR